MQYENSLLGHDAIPLSEVPSLLPKRRGKKVHYLTIWRWATKGLGGKKLQSIKVGRYRYTTRAALREFLGDGGTAVDLTGYQETLDAELAKMGL